MQALANVEGSANSLKITQDGTIADGQRCKGIDIYEWEGGPGVTMRLQCDDAVKTWRVDLKDIESNRITIERSLEEEKPEVDVIPQKDTWDDYYVCKNMWGSGPDIMVWWKQNVIEAHPDHEYLVLDKHFKKHGLGEKATLQFHDVKYECLSLGDK
jgi:hypothetical protein